MQTIQIRRLGPGDERIALLMFKTMAEVFDDQDESNAVEPLGEEDAAQLLERPDFWAIGALDNNIVVGGLTAHVLPMTRSRTKELFLYDLAVQPERQRKGIGRALVEHALLLAKQAGIETTFVPADNEDTHALSFYRALGGESSPVTMFTFTH